MSDRRPKTARDAGSAAIDAVSGDSQRRDRVEFERLAHVIRELRARCPWDREQTVKSLSKHLVEEAYEALDAINIDDGRAIADELGDLMAQLLAAAVIAEEQQRFTVAHMLQWAADKLIRRHPHVYQDAAAKTAKDVVKSWNRTKQEERKKAGARSALDGIARALPALTRAQKLGARAREAGMDWADIHAVLAKVREEIDETEAALAQNDATTAARELGDMMLAIANAPRFIAHDAEETLRIACDKFATRFVIVERLATERGLDLKSLRAEEVESLWQEAKRSADTPDER